MVPKNIHQIWLGNKRIPKHLKEWMNEIKESHPDYNYFLWTDSNIPKLPAELQEVYDSLDHPAMKSDLMRLYVLLLHGGIYLDTDYKLLSNLNNLNCFHAEKEIITYEKKEAIEDICNSVIIGSQNSRFIKFVVSKINSKGMWLGPHFYAECVLEFLSLSKKCSTEELLEACNSQKVHAVDWEFIDKKIAKHNFLASWYPNSEWKAKLESGDYE